MTLYKKIVKSNSDLEDFLYSVGLIPDLFNIVLEYASYYGIVQCNNYTDYVCDELVMREYSDVAIIYNNGKPKLYINKEYNNICNSQFVHINYEDAELDFKWYKKCVERNIKNYKQCYFDLSSETEFNFPSSKKQDKDTLFRMGCNKGLFNRHHKKHTFDYLYALYKSELSTHDIDDCPYKRDILVMTLLKAGYSCTGTKPELYFMIKFYDLEIDDSVETKTDEILINMVSKLNTRNYTFQKNAIIFISKLCKNIIDRLSTAKTITSLRNIIKSIFLNDLAYFSLKKRDVISLPISYIQNVPIDVAKCICSTVEYICKEIIESSKNVVRDKYNIRIAEKHVRIAIKKDDEMYELFKQFVDE